jgi:hypothetical protein
MSADPAPEALFRSSVAVENLVRIEAMLRVRRARDFDPQQVGYRVVAGEAPSCNKGESLFSATDGDGKPIHGDSVLGHSLEGTPGPDNPVIGRLLTEDERFDPIEYLKTL